MERVCYNENNRKQGVPAEIFTLEEKHGGTKQGRICIRDQDR